MSGHLAQRVVSNATCEGKEQFASFGVADGIAKKRSRHGKKNHVYKCGTCHCFHLGGVVTGGKRRRQHEEIDDEVET